MCYQCKIESENGINVIGINVINPIYLICERPKENGGTNHQLIKLIQCVSVGGVTVSMVAFQAVDPGSTPGRRTEILY